MANLVDQLVVEFRLDSTLFSQDATKAEALIDGLLRRLQQQANQIERLLGRSLEDSFVRLARSLLGLFGIYAGFEGFKRLIEDAISATTTLANLSKITGELPDDLNRYAVAVKSIGGSEQEAQQYFNSLNKALMNLQTMSLGPGYTPDPMLQALARILGPDYVFKGKKPSEIANAVNQKIQAYKQEFGEQLTIQRLMAAGFPKGFALLITRETSEYQRLLNLAPPVTPGQELAGEHWQEATTRVSAAMDAMKRSLMTMLDPLALAFIQWTTDFEPATERVKKAFERINEILRSWYHYIFGGDKPAAPASAPFVLFPETGPGAPDTIYDPMSGMHVPVSRGSTAPVPTPPPPAAPTAPPTSSAIIGDRWAVTPPQGRLSPVSPAADLQTLSPTSPAAGLPTLSPLSPGAGVAPPSAPTLNPLLPSVQPFKDLWNGLFPDKSGGLPVNTPGAAINSRWSSLALPTPTAMSNAPIEMHDDTQTHISSLVVHSHAVDPRGMAKDVLAEIGGQRSILREHAPLVPDVLSTQMAGGALQPGSRGNDVRSLQSRLDIKQTGVYDGQTVTAVKQLQRSHDMSPTGITGPDTMSNVG